MDETSTPLQLELRVRRTYPYFAGATHSICKQHLLREFRQKNRHTVLVNVFEHLERIVSSLHKASNVHDLVST